MARNSAASLGDRKINAPIVLICEGEDEQDILIWLRTARGLTESDIEIYSAKGRTNFLTFLQDVQSWSGFSQVRKVAVVGDSEENPAQSKVFLASLGDALRKGIQYIPIQLPSEVATGSLESLVVQHISGASGGYQCAQEWERCVLASPIKAFNTEAQQKKAWLQVWLTHYTQSTAYSRIGYAYKNNEAVRKELTGIVPIFNKILDELLGPHV